MLVFDYARPNSIAEHHDRVRARQLASGGNHEYLYNVLFGLVLRSDAIGGETNHAHLKSVLREAGIEIGRSLNLAKARERIEELSRFALLDINVTVSHQRLGRTHRDANWKAYSPRPSLPHALSKSVVQAAPASPGCSNPPPKAATCCRGCLRPIERRPAVGRRSEAKR